MEVYEFVQYNWQWSESLIIFVFSGKTPIPIENAEEGIKICLNDEHPAKA